jgi:AcrR family transcriptional regulator
MGKVTSRTEKKQSDALRRMADLLDAGTLSKPPGIDDFSKTTGISGRTLHRHFASVENMLRLVHGERLARRPLPPLELIQAGVTNAKTDRELQRAIDAAVAANFSPETRLARRVRAHVFAAALYDRALAERVGQVLDAEHEALTSALFAARHRGLLTGPHDPGDIAHALVLFTFGHLSFDLFPARSGWREVFDIQRLMWHLVLRGGAPSPQARVATPVLAVTPASAPPTLPPDQHAKRLLNATMIELERTGEANLQLRDLLKSTELDARYCYRWFGDAQSLFDAGHAQLLVQIDEPDAERFALEGRMTRSKIAAHLTSATAAILAPHRAQFRKRRIARLGITLGRPHLEGVAAYSSVVMLQRLIALYERWAEELHNDIHPIGSAYAAIVLSEGAGYLDFMGRHRPGGSLERPIVWLAQHISRLEPHHAEAVAPFARDDYERHRDELSAHIGSAELPILPEAPRRRRQVNADHLLELAIHILHEEGIGALHLSELARRAGMGTANVMYYYPTRDLLLGSLAAHLLEGQMERLKGMLEGIPVNTETTAEALITATLRFTTRAAEAATIRELQALASSFAPVMAVHAKHRDTWHAHQLRHLGADPDEPSSEPARTLLDLLTTLAEGAAYRHPETLTERARQRTLIEPTVKLLAPSLQAALRELTPTVLPRQEEGTPARDPRRDLA